MNSQAVFLASMPDVPSNTYSQTGGQTHLQVKLRSTTELPADQGSQSHQRADQLSLIFITGPSGVCLAGDGVARLPWQLSCRI